MTVELVQQEATQLVELFILYSKKNAFTIDEYGDVFTMYTKIKDFLVKAQAEQNSTEKLTLEQKELNYLVKVMEVCSQRTPVEVQNYKAISALFDHLGSMTIKEEDSPVPSTIEEVKEEE